LLSNLYTAYNDLIIELSLLLLLLLLLLFTIFFDEDLATSGSQHVDVVRDIVAGARQVHSQGNNFIVLLPKVEHEAELIEMLRDHLRDTSADLAAGNREKTEPAVAVLSKTKTKDMTKTPKVKTPKVKTR